MLFCRSSPSFATVLAMVVFSVLAMLATSPLAEAGCTYECAGISAKILFCGNVIRDGITDELPTIGIDSSVDNCLCTQDNVRLVRNCQACKDLNNAMNKTNKFISDCKILDQNRNLVNSGASRLANGVVYVVIAVASAGLAAAL